MRSTRLASAIGVLTAALLSVAACGSGEQAASNTTTSAAATTTTTTSSAAMSDGVTTTGDVFGAGCAALPKDTEGSLDGMVDDPVATAASNNPLLKTLVAAVSGGVNPKVNLVDTLNGGEFTVFAPVDEAFKAPAVQEALPTLSKPKGAELLTSILTYHVVPGQVAPADITGNQPTVQGGNVRVTGSGDSLKVNGANVICGGVKTANATVYLIDQVLMPKM